MIRSLRGPLVVLLAVALAAVGLAHIASTAWISRSVSHDAYRVVVPVLRFNILVELIVIALVLYVVKWLVGRDRRDRLDKARLDHLAEVAAMSGGFAHEARNLLHALQARIDLLRKNILGDAKGEERVNKLEELATDMEHLFTDFLTLARPADDDLEEADIASLIQQVVEFEELELERANIHVQCDFSAAAPRALVDRGKLKRAILNLIVNARHAMSDGGLLTLRVSAKGKRVEVQVADTGCGIARDDLSRIFQTYYTTKSDGTGLGLAIVRRTIEDFGGKITCKSTTQKGTTFTIVLPSVEQHQATTRRVLKELSLRKTAG